MSERNLGANCGNCLFGEENETCPLTVDCHLFPPVYVGDEEHDGELYSVFRFPSHKTTAWCAQHSNFWKNNEVNHE